MFLDGKFKKLPFRNVIFYPKLDGPKPLATQSTIARESVNYLEGVLVGDSPDTYFLVFAEIFFKTGESKFYSGLIVYKESYYEQNSSNVR